MIELPEALTLAAQLQTALNGKTVDRVLPPTKPHKFCFWNGDPCEYEKSLRGRCFSDAQGFGIYVEMYFDNGEMLCINDGVNLRYCTAADAPKDYQLLIIFTDKTALAFTVAMYGGIVLHGDGYDNSYYLKSKEYVSPFSDDFGAHFRNLLATSKPNLSMKALLATEQRFPGIGNGVVQDILFNARLHPKRKLSTLDENEKDAIEKAVVHVLHDMTASGGRDTERDIYGKNGGYTTLMSKNGLTRGCPVCGCEIRKEAYLGGSVYYCPNCQPL